MTDIEFDDGVADMLISAAHAAGDELRAQGPARRTAAENASEDFSGAYAMRFTEAMRTEAADRPALARSLDTLVASVRAVKASAAKERQRLEDVAAWNQREEDRKRALTMSPPSLAMPTHQPPLLFEIPPSSVPIVPEPVEATFVPRGRVRTGTGTSNGRSSADPSRLRSFASTCRANDTAAAAKESTLKAAWASFMTSCAWARVGSVSVIHGFDRYLDENAADAAWMDRVAGAFERAGGDGSLPDVFLDVEDNAHLPAGLERLFKSGLSAKQVAERWADLGYAQADERVISALPRSVLQELGNLEGVPYWARAAANTAVLDQRIAELTDRYWRRDADGMLRDQSEDVSGDLTALTSIRSSLVQGVRAGSRSLISLTTDHPPLAAVAIGNVDTARNVTWAVPGMNSSTHKMTDWANAAQNVYDRQVTVDRHGGEHAVIAWMGYKSPPIPVTGDLGVLNSASARKGGDNLADAMRGISAVRAEDMPRNNVLAHSYGTTAAAFGLTQKGVHVDSLTMVASAGIPDSIENANEIHADHVYAGQARNVLPAEWGQGDPLAIIGRNRSEDHKVDPTGSDFGATTFGADGTIGPDGAKRLAGVKDHGVHTDNGTGYLDPNTESLRNVALATTGHGNFVSPYTRKLATPFEVMSGVPLTGLATQ